MTLMSIIRDQMNKPEAFLRPTERGGHKGRGLKCKNIKQKNKSEYLQLRGNKCLLK